MNKQTTLQKIDKIISDANLIIGKNIDPTDTDAIINFKFGIIESCIKELAKSIDKIK